MAVTAEDLVSAEASIVPFPTDGSEAVFTGLPSTRIKPGDGTAPSGQSTPGPI